MMAHASHRLVRFALALSVGIPTISPAPQPREQPSAIDPRAQHDTREQHDTRAPVDSLLVQRERAQWKALQARDTTAFARLMGGNLVDVDVTGIRRTSPGSTSRYVLGCQIARYALRDVRVAHFESTTIVSYSATLEGMCWGQKTPSPLYVMTVYERHAGAWNAIAHSETPAAPQ